MKMFEISSKFILICSTSCHLILSGMALVQLKKFKCLEKLFYICTCTLLFIFFPFWSWIKNANIPF